MTTFHFSNKAFSVILAFLVLLAGSQSPAWAALDPTTFTQELNNLTLEGNTLIATVTGTVLTPITAVSQIADLTSQVDAYQANVQLAYDQVIAESGTTMSLTNEMLIALQTLSATQATLAESVLGLSASLVPLATVTMEDSFYSMLRLSDDIGSMADRILEMADKILVMADNIGIMADRILATQVIQSTNIGLTYNAILQTQQNMLTLFSMFQ